VYGPQTNRAIQSAQRQLGVQTDGLITPGGSTQRAFQQQTASRPSLLDANAPKSSRPLPALNYAAISSNQRTAKHLRKIAGTGDLSTFTADAITNGDDKAMAEVSDLIGQVHANNPSQAKDLFESTIAKLHTKKAEALKGTLSAGPGANRHGPEKEPAVPKFPANKKAYLKGQEANWNEQFDAASQLHEITPAERQVYMDLFGQEGGVKLDNSGTAVGGIRQATIDGLKERGYLSNIPTNVTPNSLEPIQRAAVYRAYFDDVLHTVGGAESLATIGNQKSASAFGDTLFRNGRKGGTEAIQKAINATGSHKVEVDGRMGPETINTYRDLSSNSSNRKKLLDVLAVERLHQYPNESNRFNYFRIMD